MDLETHRKIYKIKQDNYRNYVKEKMEALDALSKNDINVMMDIINKDFIDEKNNIINETLEISYNHKKYKKIVNKDKYINKIKKHIYIIDSIKDYVKRTYNINNDYSLYYCKFQAIELINIYKNKKEIYKILKHLIHKLSILELKYSDILKVLYSETKNYDELKNIRKYEKIYRKSLFEQQEQMMNITNAVSKNIKTLKYNCDKTIDNGFFGL